MWNEAERWFDTIDPLAEKLETLPPGTSTPVAVNAPLVASSQVTFPKNVEEPENDRPKDTTVPVKVCGGGAFPPNTLPPSVKSTTTGEPMAPIPPTLIATVIGPLEPKVMSFHVPT
jgi:hypothetical protein